MMVMVVRKKPRLIAAVSVKCLFCSRHFTLIFCPSHIPTEKWAFITAILPVRELSSMVTYLGPRSHNISYLAELDTLVELSQ